MQEELSRVVAFFGLGEIRRIERAGGHTSKNFFVTTERGSYLIKITAGSCGAADGRPAPEFLRRLTDHHFRIVPYLCAKSGEYAFSEGGIVATVQEKLDARPPEEVTKEMVAQVGAELAGLHLIPSQGLPEKRYWMRPDYLREATALIKERYLGVQGLEELVAAYDRLNVDWTGLPQAVLHGDLFIDNTLFHDKDLVVFIDWDEVGVGAAVLDFGMAVTDWCFRGDRFDAELYDAFFQGYVRVRPFSDDELRAITPAVKFAAVTCAVWRFLDGNHYHPEGRLNERYKRFWTQGLDRWEAP